MSSTLLETKKLTKLFPVQQGLLGERRFLRAVDGVDLRLDEGETLGLAGESGCGKSTVAKLLMNLIPPTDGCITYRGNRLDSLDKDDLFAFRRQVQMIFQDPQASLNPRMRVEDIIGEPLKIHRLATAGEYRGRVLELMHRVGLHEEHLHRYPHEFSGGQRQRIGIARALAVQPKIIIADEPVSALDISIQAQIINLLQELRHEYGLSMLFIAHDLSVVRHLSSSIAIMYLGKIVEQGGRDAVFDRFLHPYTQALISAIPKLSPTDKKERIILKGDLPSPLSPPTGCPFHPRCIHGKVICTREIPLLEEKEPGHWAACHFSEKLFR
jgi:peptide/nickel transport system ATP-binding protein